jgi:hypothetical protein
MAVSHVVVWSCGGVVVWWCGGESCGGVVRVETEHALSLQILRFLQTKNKKDFDF